MESREGFGSELPHSRQRRERNSVGWVTARAKRVLQCSSEGASGGVRYPSEPAVGVCAGSLFPPNVSLLRTSLLAPPKRIKFCVSRELATPCAAHLLARLSLSLRNSGQVRCAVSRPIAGTRRGSHREILVAYERPVLICVGVRNGSRAVLCLGVSLAGPRHIADQQQGGGPAIARQGVELPQCELQACKKVRMRDVQLNASRPSLTMPTHPSRSAGLV